MSLLQPIVDNLFANENWVVFDPHGHRQPLKVLAVALFTFNDVPMQVVVCEDFDAPLTFTNELVHNPASGSGDLVQAVDRCHEAEPHMNSLRGISKDTNANEIFARLLSGNYDRGYVKLLEFCPVKEVFKTFHSNALETFDGVGQVLNQNGLLLYPKAMINLEYVGDRARMGYSRGEPNPRTNLDYGNILMWMGNGDIHWVTRREGSPIPEVIGLGAVATACDYNEFIRFTREFNCRGWGIRGVNPMPYNLPKRDDSGIRRGNAERFTRQEESKPAPELNPTHVNDVLSAILNAETTELHHSTMVLLGAIVQRHIPEPKVDAYLKYEAILEKAINEYFVILDGVGAKKRGEIKEGLKAHFMAQYRVVFPELK